MRQNNLPLIKFGESKEVRFKLLMDYYHTSENILLQIANLKQNERKVVCKLHNIDPYIIRTMLDYNRYRECASVYDLLRKCGENISEFEVLDFGCLVADYGIFFARSKARISVYDKEEVVKFVKFRFSQENLFVNTFTIPCDYNYMMAGKDLVIFGEVLEHLDNPVEPLNACISQSVRNIFTTCYPFGDDNYFNMPGHSRSAQELQPTCIQLLLTQYEPIPSLKKAVLWRRIDLTPEKRT